MPEILQIVTQLEPGGAQTLAAWLERRFTAQGYGISTAFLYKKFPNDAFEQPQILVHHQPKFHDALRLTLRMASLVREMNPDVLIAHTHYAMSVTGPVAMALRIPVIFVHHAPRAIYPLSTRVVETGLRMMHARHGHVFVADTIATKRGIVIRNPPPDPMDTTDVPLAHKPDLLAVGRLSREKGIDLAISAMASLPDRKLHLVGDGPEAAALKSFAKHLDVDDRVEFIGLRPALYVRALMRRASAILIPSRSEALPMVALEAIAENCPIVVSDIPQLTHLVSRRVAIGFDSGDAASLANAIRALDDSGRRSSLAEGRALLLASVSAEELARRWVEEVAAVMNT